MHRVALGFAVLVAACATPDEQVLAIERGESPALDEEFPTPTTLGEFNGKWFEAKRSVTIVERAPEGDGYRALGIDVDSGQVVFQVVGPREEVKDVMTSLAIAGLEFEGCGIGQGVFTPPPVPPPSCGGRRCYPVDYVMKAQALVEMSCP